ncbi:hypothetical protein C8A01DRAFT_37592 [Parachaetomium inaequale]|uniref:Cyclin-dependent kinase n=1 Tax=Parachaetomium inaequale TaxID=2588326 RepID=A0AAN6SQ52_9PEZI|nr:hypothetical protein C8A01DRAFT_37592 [Parachaetomium inaequale]
MNTPTTTTSPVRRRVLGALDPNACSPGKVRRQLEGGKLFSTQPQQSPVKEKAAAAVAFGAPPTPRRMSVAAATSPRRVSSSSPSPSGTPEKETWSKKRGSASPTFIPAPAHATVLGVGARVEEEGEGGEPAAKRACLESAREEEGQTRRAESPPSSTSTTRTTGTTRHRSASPDTPSVFDNSAVDNSQVTILTEPDVTGPAPAPVAAAAPPLPAPRARPTLTREQAREKAEILRLRLGLASYKVRTGQTDVPLDRLEATLAAGARRARGSSFHGHTQQAEAGACQGPTSVSASFPPPGATSTTAGAGRVGNNRRPLPRAPLRRGSSSASVSFEEARSAITRDERRHQNPHYHHHQQQPQQQRHHQNQHQHQHQRRQSEVLDTRGEARRYMYAAENGVPPRPRTATDVADLSSSLRRRASSSFVGYGEEEDLESRGGAASGLLSLARS